MQMQKQLQIHTLYYTVYGKSPDIPERQVGKADGNRLPGYRLWGCPLVCGSKCEPSSALAVVVLSLSGILRRLPSDVLRDFWDVRLLGMAEAIPGGTEESGLSSFMSENTVKL